MIRIRFPDAAAKHRALGYLAGRFSFKSFSTGEMIVPPEALRKRRSQLAAELVLTASVIALSLSRNLASLTSEHHLLDLPDANPWNS